MCALLNALLREGRVSVREKLVSRDPAAMRLKLKEQLEIYSYQFKAAANTFGKEAVALSGKVGGMKCVPPFFACSLPVCFPSVNNLCLGPDLGGGDRDDICICLQLGVLYTSPRK